MVNDPKHSFNSTNFTSFLPFNLFRCKLDLRSRFIERNWF
nr:MAG TPA: hypothetical protein [Caudoviricetes sp.]